jgi:hypothetical protein
LRQPGQSDPGASDRAFARNRRAARSGGVTRAHHAQLLTNRSSSHLPGRWAGLLLAHQSIRLILALHPPDIQRPELIEINLSVLAFTAPASILTTLLVGLAPAIAVSRADLNSALKSGGAWGASAARVRSRQFLIAVEVALALILVAGAGTHAAQFS